MSSSTPRNATHVVKIYLKRGFGLGEILSLERYELVKMQDAILEEVRKKIGPPAPVSLDGENDAVVLLSSDHICLILHSPAYYYSQYDKSSSWSSSSADQH
jgi:hypothetical protein